MIWFFVRVDRRPINYAVFFLSDSQREGIRAKNIFHFSPQTLSAFNRILTPIFFGEKERKRFRFEKNQPLSLES